LVPAIGVYHKRKWQFYRQCTILRLFYTDVGQWMSANRLKLNTDKTGLLWAGPRHGQSSLTDCGPSLQLEAALLLLLLL